MPSTGGSCRFTLAEASGSALIETADEVDVSAPSIREIAIGARPGKIQADPVGLAAARETSGFLELPVSAPHAAGVGQMPLYHNDAFERLLIARALAESMKLITLDEVVVGYSDIVMLV